MNAEIISIGTEILMGEIVDTNAAYLASHLPVLGIELRYVSQVDDDMERLTEVLGRAWRRSEVTLTTGGLGPTSDDITREAIAQTMGEELAVDEAILENLRAYFQSRGSAMPAHNVKQANLITSAQAISNPVGTAPGWWTEKDGHTIVSMPGVPRELERMWEHEVSPRLRKRMKGVTIVSRTLKTFGHSEATVNEMVHPLFESENPKLGIYAKADGIHLRAFAKAASEAEALELLAPMEERIRSIMGSSIWAVDNETAEERVGALLRERHLTMGTMESFTGGLLAGAITEVPGSSDYFMGGIVSYTNQTKIAYGVDPLLIEEHGAVSLQVAEAMAVAACSQLNADVGIGTTGVAGPSEMEGQPAGTAFIGISHNGHTRSVSGRYPPQRGMVRRRAITQALLEVIKTLAETP